MVESLSEDVGLVLEAHALLAHNLVGSAAVVAHLRAELGASSLEEICLLRVGGLDVSGEKKKGKMAGQEWVIGGTW